MFKGWVFCANFSAVDRYLLIWLQSQINAISIFSSPLHLQCHNIQVWPRYLEETTLLLLLLLLPILLLIIPLLLLLLLPSNAALDRYSKHASLNCGNLKRECSKIPQPLKDMIEYLEKLYLLQFFLSSRNLLCFILKVPN